VAAGTEPISIPVSQMVCFMSSATPAAPVTPTTKSVHAQQKINARVAIHMCILGSMSACFKLFGIACVIQDFCIQNKEYLVAETS